MIMKRIRRRGGENKTNASALIPPRRRIGDWTNVNHAQQLFERAAHSADLVLCVVAGPPPFRFLHGACC